MLLGFESARPTPEAPLRYVHRDAARHVHQRRCSNMDHRDAARHVSSGRCPAWSSEVEHVNIQREGGAWKGGNLNLCGVLNISSELCLPSCFLAFAASSLCNSTLLCS
ncbi:hypothetical protein RchiOBHm_Chr4g0404911 [Rosa chinensis]|uniref:Uncharacterized protein n=1 Tax=Rosa chinensis TaxID=74649 RepID=A0A2P6QTY0_ROSCH|nr:hypothetical protein RchiOBHm_Chr4g0404911 [Rosa chinensis]